MGQEANPEGLSTMKRLVLLSCVVWLMLGCGKVNPRPALADVNDIVRGRSGHSVDWAEDPAEFERRREAVAALIQEPLTTETAVQIGVLNNRGLQAELEEISIAQADLVQAGLVSNPSFGLGIQFAHSSEHVDKQEFSLTQDLLDFVLLSPRKKIAVNELERTKFSVATELLDFIAQVKRAFYSLQSSVQLANRLKLILEINEAGADLAQKQFEGGTLNELDLANQQALYQETRASLAQAEIQIRLNREQVNRLLGLWGDLLKWKIVEQLPPSRRKICPCPNGRPSLSSAGLTWPPRDSESTFCSRPFHSRRRRASFHWELSLVSPMSASRRTFT